MSDTADSLENRIPQESRTRRHGGHASPASRPSHRRQARRTLRHRFQSRLASAPRKVSRIGSRARLLSLTLFVVCVWILVWFSTADMFFVGEVVVEGNASISAGEIVKASGALNYSVFFLQFGEIERAVSKVPGVQSATARYEWPHIVRVEVAERKALFAWQSNKRTLGVDETGVLFPSDAPLLGLLIVRDNDNKTRDRLDAKLVSAIRAIGVALPALKRIEYADAKGISLTDERGWKVLIGQPEQINAKLALLRALSDYLAAQKVEPEYLDVRLPERAFYKPK